MTNFHKECQFIFEKNFIATLIHCLLCLLLIFRFQPYERKKKPKLDENGEEIPIKPEEELELAELKERQLKRQI